MSQQRTGVAIIGTGNIAGPYVKDLRTYPELEFIGAADIDSAKAAAFGAEHGIDIFPSVEALLNDDRVSIVVNLSSHFAHPDITRTILRAGKHAFSEKPMAPTYVVAQSLIEEAAERGLRLGSAPITLLGEAQQTAWKLVRDGKIGDVTVAYAEVNWGRIEAWHPAPAPFYEIGPLYDVGVYPLTILTAMFGPAQRVLSYGRVVYPDRTTKDGAPFHITTPDFNVSLIELSGGVTVRLTTNFYIGHRTRQTGIEFHGHLGSIHLQYWHEFNAEVYLGEFGKQFERVEPVREPYPGVSWGRGVAEMAQAIQQNRPHRFSGEHAAHVIEILNAATTSMQTQCPVELHSTFSPPAPMDWAE